LADCSAAATHNKCLVEAGLVWVSTPTFQCTSDPERVTTREDKGGCFISFFFSPCSSRFPSDAAVLHAGLDAEAGRRLCSGQHQHRVDPATHAPGTGEELDGTATLQHLSFLFKKTKTHQTKYSLLLKVMTKWRRTVRCRFAVSSAGRERALRTSSPARSSSSSVRGGVFLVAADCSRMEMSSTESTLCWKYCYNNIIITPFAKRFKIAEREEEERDLIAWFIFSGTEERRRSVKKPRLHPVGGGNGFIWDSKL